MPVQFRLILTYERTAVMLTRKTRDLTAEPMVAYVTGLTRKRATATFEMYAGALATVDRGTMKSSTEYVPGPQ